MREILGGMNFSPGAEASTTTLSVSQAEIIPLELFLLQSLSQCSKP